jgi:bifunctional non-homologous end joining protein LigD
MSASVSSVAPMLATTGDAPLTSPLLAYEPKYDGIRAIVAIEPGVGTPPRVQLWSRLGNEKTTQFPEIAEALRQWATTLDRRVILDGEIVALDSAGRPAGFQNLQGRIHVTKIADHKGPRRIGSPLDASSPLGTPTALILFDLLHSGGEDLRRRPLRDRRARLEQLLRGLKGSRLRVTEQAVGDGRALYSQALSDGWEGLIAKRLDSVYQSGRRSPDWCKIKLVRHQTCVVGGWTEPRGSRPCFGALLLGVHDEAGVLRYVGHSGAGFSDAELERVWQQLHVLETSHCPFTPRPKTNERPHWVKPQLVAEVKFTEWTADGILRHPTYLGMRDDVRADTVRKEPGIERRRVSGGPEGPPLRAGKPRRASRDDGEADLQVRLLSQLDAIDEGGGNGVLQLPEGQRLEVTNLHKVFWPDLKLTKGDLLRHYVRVASAILPVLADRPLVMKRYPNGIDAKPFYQHRAADKLPPGVRMEVADSGNEQRPHIIGGDLLTLLYTAQLASISQDPWFSRVGSETFVDHIALDLDPPEDLPFARILDVARWVRDELTRLKAPAFAKTSGSGGVHVYVPMPPKTPYEAGLIYAQIVATMVANAHPKQATVERSVSARGRRVYVDYLQNIRSKTLASAYSARANEFAGVSTPLRWEEIDEGGLSPRDFTVVNFGERLASVGDLWAGLRKSKGADLRAVVKVAR